MMGTSDPQPSMFYHINLAGCGKTQLNETDASQIRSPEPSTLFRERVCPTVEAPLWATWHAMEPWQLMSRLPRGCESAPDYRLPPRR
jgi:hypothetical protein